MITATGGNALTNPYSTAAARAAREAKEAEAEENGEAADAAEDAENTDGTTDTGSTGGTGKIPTDEELAAKKFTDYKKDFLTKVRTLMQSSHLAGVTLDLNISEDGFKRMMNDTIYEKSVLDKLRANTGSGYTKLSGTLSLGANGKDTPSARLEESMTISQRLFSNSSKTMLRSLGIDAMMSLADTTLAGLEVEKGRFATASEQGVRQMRMTNSYLDQYIESLNPALDTTG